MRTNRLKDYFTIHEAAELSRFSKYMLDYLVRDEIFLPEIVRTQPNFGVRRLYSYGDVVLLRALRSICDQGKIRHLKDALLKFRLANGPICPGARLDQYLAVENNELCVYTPDEGAMELRSGQFTFGFVVDLKEVSAHIADAVVVDASDRFRLRDELFQLVETKRQEAWKRTQELRDLRRNAGAAA